MNLIKFKEELETLIKQHEVSRDFCEAAYLEDTAAGKEDAYKWRDTKRFWSEKAAILQDIKDLVQEYLDTVHR